MKKTKNEVALDGRQELLALYAQVEECTQRVHAAIKSAVEIYFEAGKKLELLWAKAPGGTALKDFYKSLDLPERHATNSLKIFKHFREKPEAIQGLSVSDALKAIVSCNKEQHALPERKHYNLGAADEQLEFSWEDSFEKAPLAKVELDNYRLESFEDKESSFWLVQRGVDIPVKVVDIFIPKPDNPALKLSHENMRKDVQKAIEKYYSHVEKDQNKEEENA